MSSALINHAVKTVWQEPLQDRQFNIGLARLTPNGGVIHSQKVLWHTVYTPKVDGRKWFHIYQVGEVPEQVLNMFIDTNNWQTVESVCESAALLIDVYLTTGGIVPRSKIWVMKDFTGNILVAIEHSRTIDYGKDVSVDSYTGTVKDQKLNLDNSGAVIRFYSNAEFTNFSFRDQAIDPVHPVQMHYNIVNNQKDYNDFVAGSNAIIRKFGRSGMGVYYTDGFITNYPTAYTASMNGKVLGFMWDESFKFDMFFDIKDLPVFTSKVDKNRNKFLLLTDEVYDIIDYHDDIDFYLVRRNGPTFKGIYISRLPVYAFRMVTHSAYAVDSEHLQYYSNLHGFLGSLEDCSIYIMVRQGGKHQGLVNQKNRIEELYHLGKKDEIRNAMVNTNALVPEWSAAELEYSAYCALMQAKYDQITLPLVQAAYGYNTVTQYMCPPVTNTKRIGRLEQIEVPPALMIPDNVNGYSRRVAFCYDSNGRMISYFADSSSDIYINVPPEITGTKWVEVFNAATGEDSGIYVNQDVEHNDLEQYGFRCYVSTLFALEPIEDWEDVTDTNLYTYTPADDDNDPKIVWNWKLLAQAGLVPAVKTNAYMTIYSVVFDRSEDKDGAIDFVFRSRQKWGNEVKYKIQKLPPAQYTVFANGKSLIEDIDYFVKWPNFVIVNKEISALDHVEFIVRAYGCPYPVANGPAIPFKPREVGFIKNGRLSSDGEYDINNDKNIRVVVENKFKHTQEVNFHEEDVGPLSREGAPYCIEDYILPVENFTEGIRTNEFYLDTLESDNRVSRYLTQWKPDKDYGRNFVEKNRWAVISPVIASMLYAISSGYAIDANTNDNFDSLEIEFWLKPWEWLLEFDPAYKKVDTNFIHIAPHPYNKNIAVTQKQYELLEGVIKLKLNNLVDLSKYVTIKP